MAFTDRLHNRGSISTGYDIDNSCKFEDDNDEWLSKTTGSDWNRVKWTASFWVKRSELSSNVRFFAASDSSYDFRVRFQGSGDTLAFYNSDSTGSCSQNSTAVFRDTSAWYHIVAVWDTANSTAGNRQRLYVNGIEVTDFATDTQPAQNQKSVWGKTDSGSGTVTMGIGAQYNYYSGFVQGYCGYMAEWHWVEGQALSPTDFGVFDQNSDIWKPKEYAGTYGTNGFYLDFKSASDLGADASGNGNNWTKNNITAANQATDTPTNNFSTFNVLHPYSSASNHNPTFTEGATRFTTLLSGYWEAAVASMGITSGKWYFEAQPGTSTSHITSIGYGDESDIHDWGQNIADTNGFCGETGTNSIGYFGSDTSSSYGNVWLGTGSTSNVNANYTISNIVGVAIDADNGYVYFAKDNTYVNSGNPGSGASGTGGYTFQDTTTTRTGTVFPAVAGYYHTAATVININFGGYTTMSISSAATDANGYGTFEYAPPSGYYALCTKNLALYG